jgi:hypothetical protein
MPMDSHRPSSNARFYSCGYLNMIHSGIMLPYCLIRQQLPCRFCERRPTLGSRIPDEVTRMLKIFSLLLCRSRMSPGKRSPEGTNWKLVYFCQDPVLQNSDFQGDRAQQCNRNIAKKRNNGVWSQ